MSNPSRMKKIVTVGEVLWDLFPDGPKVGGAPGNFSFHCAQLGADVALISAVGEDSLGHALLEYYRRIGLATDWIDVLPDYSTGTVAVEFCNGEPRYTIRENVAWDRVRLEEKHLERVAGADVLYYGSLEFRSDFMRRQFERLVAAHPKEAIRFFDINLRAPFYDGDHLMPLLRGANVLKLNESELDILSAMLGVSGRSVEATLETIREKFDYRLIILTGGASGARLVSGDGSSFRHGESVEVVDTVGAGDSFSAMTVVGLLEGLSLEAINENANRLAAFVCTQRGGTPQYSPAALFPTHFRR